MSRRSRLIVPLLFSIALFALYWFVSENPSLLGNEAETRAVSMRLLLFVAWLPLIFFVVRAVDLIAFDVIVSRRQNVRAPILLREIVSIVLFAVAIVTALSWILEVKVTAFLATGTVLAAVLGLALQDTLGNLFAGIALHLEDSFEVGDVIHIGDVYGVVETVRWRATRLRTFNNNVLILPNSVVARDRLEVFPRKNLNARVLQVGIDYNFPPARVIGVLTQAASNVEGVAHELPCFARVAGFGDSSVVYEIKYFTSDYSQRDRIDADIRKAVWYALRRNAISIPFPIRMHTRYAVPEQGHLPDAATIIERLANVDFLSPLPRTAHEAIADVAHTHVYSRGETILRQGAAGDSMFIVHDGTVSVRVEDAEVAKLGEGEFFGEMALLTGEKRAADIVALDDVVAVEITKDALQPILHDHPDLAAAISAKVTERRGTLDSLREGSREEAQKTILSRIRSYFGL